MASAPAAAGDATGSKEHAVDALILDDMRDKGIPGLQLAVVQHGHIILLRHYGIANLQDDVAVTDESVFSINSMTKAFTGVAIMQLVQGKRLDLDAPVSRYLLGLPGAWQPVTIRQLLTHMSGIPDILGKHGEALVGDGGQDSAWTTVQTLPMDFAPGERFSYNQTNYVLLGKVIDTLTDKPFAEVIAERQFHLARMSSTAFGDSLNVIPHRAPSYRFTYATPSSRGELKNVSEVFTPLERGGAGINSTAKDVAGWLVALETGRLLDATQLKQLWTPGKFSNGIAGEWALGWVTVQRADHPAVGATGGGRSALYVYPKDDTAVVMLTNLAGAYPEELIDEVAAVYIPGMRLNGVARLRVELRKRGFDNARNVFDDLCRMDPSFELTEDDLNNWAYRMLRSGNPSQAIAVFKLAVSLYPTSGNAYDSLADGYEVIDQPDLAIANYKRSLELDPKNMNAVNRLKVLDSAGSKNRVW